MTPRIQSLLVILAFSTCNLAVPGDAGDLLVQARTTGGDFDLDGYVVVLDNEREHTVTANGQIVIEDLREGDYELELRGMAPNCDAAGPSSHSVEVEAGHTARAIFEIRCDATGVSVGTAIDGLDLDRLFNIFVNDSPRTEVALLNDAQLVTRLAPGTYSVRLGDVAPNCHLEPASHTVVVTFRRVTPIQFTGQCVAAFAAVLVRVNASGEDLDLSGYTASVPGAPSVRGFGSGMVVEGVVPGTQTVRLSGVAPNCAVSGSDTKSIVVTAGRTVRDTVNAEFDVICSRLWGLALLRSGSVTLATADAARFDILVGATGRPAWAPDGGRLAYLCTKICIANLETARIDTLDLRVMSDVSWRPDGERIVFGEGECDTYYGYYCTFTGLVMTSPNGQGRTPIPLPEGVTWASTPTWAPDGAKIAFGCREVTVAEDKICVVAPDGTEFRRLTTGPGYDFSPAWSPDGLRIAFMTTRFGDPEIVVMDAASAVVTRLNPAAMGTHPTWSPDGAKILYSSTLASRPGLILVNADGSGAVQFTTTPGDGPAAWRP